MPQIKDIISVLEKLAPPCYHEGYENVGIKRQMVSWWLMRLNNSLPTILFKNRIQYI
ncbi:MAG: hypothetical protein IPJ79_02500 [Bacteroidetes bacterium]|nr:hypothetical protein [Bacteroidota bacterium]HNR20164.1 hypothetical protein [Bacteroidia bacterium]HNU34741.1 hypothetical protein [Bacteroidia bacterium]